jgi:hypothetical protein
MSRRRTEPPQPRFECELPATNRSLGLLRARFADWLSSLPERREDSIDLVLTISELAAAAVRDAADPNGAGCSSTEMLAAHAWIEDGAVAIQVVAEHPIARRETNDAERGFAIVASITDAVSVRAHGDRTLVCARKW